MSSFSKFDGIFLLKHLAQLSDDIKPIMRDSDMIELRFKFGTKNNKGKYPYTLYFRYSLLLLPASLSSLSKHINNKQITNI